jgi:hypothetical protein
MDFGHDSAVGDGGGRPGNAGVPPALLDDPVSPGKGFQMRAPSSVPRPRGITALSIFFAVGSVIALTATASLFFPGSFLEPMWQLNPRAHNVLASIGLWAPVLLATVSCACAAAAFGLWRGRRWGYHLAMGLFLVHLVSDVANVVLGTEPRAAFGIPVVALLLAFLATTRVRAFFRLPKLLHR